MTYDLWYWPGLPGRGEFVRLFLELHGLSYRDCGPDEGAEALMDDLKSRQGKVGEPYAPPYLADGDICVSQVAHILAYLSDKHGPTVEDKQLLFWLIQLQLDITDIVAEVHDVHHPVASGLYYDDQKDAAARAAKDFREERIPKWFAHFERAAGAVDGDWIGGARPSHVDTSLFQLIEGLEYAFPKRMKAVRGDYPKLFALRDSVRDLEPVAAYLASDRRQAFNEDGIFRHYPELDAA